MKPEKGNYNENEQLEKDEVESTLPDFIPSHELTNSEQDEVRGVE